MLKGTHHIVFILAWSLCSPAWAGLKKRKKQPKSDEIETPARIAPADEQSILSPEETENLSSSEPGEDVADPDANVAGSETEPDTEEVSEPATDTVEPTDSLEETAPTPPPATEAVPEDEGTNSAPEPTAPPSSADSEQIDSTTTDQEGSEELEEQETVEAADDLDAVEPSEKKSFMSGFVERKDKIVQKMRGLRKKATKDDASTTTAEASKSDEEASPQQSTYTPDPSRVPTGPIYARSPHGVAYAISQLMPDFETCLEKEQRTDSSSARLRINFEVLKDGLVGPISIVGSAGGQIEQCLVEAVSPLNFKKGNIEMPVEIPMQLRVSTEERPF